MPISDAVAAGFVAWDANAITYRVTNPSLPVVTVSFAEIDNGAVVKTQSVRVLRGEPLSDVARVSPATDALRISLCPSASEAPLPNCAIGGAVR